MDVPVSLQFGFSRRHVLQAVGTIKRIHLGDSNTLTHWLIAKTPFFTPKYFLFTSVVTIQNELTFELMVCSSSVSNFCSLPYFRPQGQKYFTPLTNISIQNSQNSLNFISLPLNFEGFKFAQIFKLIGTPRVQENQRRENERE